LLGFSFFFSRVVVLTDSPQLISYSP
jgi:hypothetical protein